MKKFMLFTAVLATLVTGARAYDLTVPKTNATVKVVMLVPPVSAGGDVSQLPVRATSVVVNAGAQYRIGSQVIVAAHAGTMTNTAVTTTTYYTNGFLTALAGAQFAATNGIAVHTNTVIAVAPITVPSQGISGYDGTVRWYRARTPDVENVRLQITVDGNGESVILTDGGGNTLKYAASVEKDFLDFPGALYVSQSAMTATNSVKVMAW